MRNFGAHFANLSLLEAITVLMSIFKSLLWLSIAGLFVDAKLKKIVSLPYVKTRVTAETAAKTITPSDPDNKASGAPYIGA